MPTVYPKSTPTEVTGLLVRLKGLKGKEEVARLAGDLDLEIDEILPSTEFAEALGLIRITDGRATMTEIGQKLLAASIRERKNILREQLRGTTLFRTLVQALETKPDRRLTEDELNSLVAFTTAPADEFVQNIINWGRYAELFRYDSDAHTLLPVRTRTPTRSSGGSHSPPSPPGTGDAKTETTVRSGGKGSRSSAADKPSQVARAVA